LHFHRLVNRYERVERALGFLDAWSLVDDADAVDRITGLDHVQLAMPPGSTAEAEAEKFYAGLLGIPRVPKPAGLAGRGGCWFERPPLRLHLGVEADFRPARKAHPALAVVGLTDLIDRLEAAGIEVQRSSALEGAEQAYVDDPFGNRLELIERIPTPGRRRRR
jgi:catechol 2,3-dioxygenase-like lactoylglutathione lyase family enzyme